jgi:nucleoid-associated protein YgaU
LIDAVAKLTTPPPADALIAAKIFAAILINLIWRRKNEPNYSMRGGKNMKISTKIFLALVIGILSLSLIAPAVAQDKKMTMEQYNNELNAAKQREANAKAEIAKLDAEIEQLRQDIASTDQQLTQAWDEIYAMLGTDRAGVEAYRNQMRSLEAEVDGLMALSPEELFKRRAEVDQLQARLNEMKKSKIALLTEMQDWIATIEGKLAQLRARMPKAIFDQYTVVRGDYLWKISKKPAIYGDPYQWMRIYSYNRDMIKNPDLIYPNWNLKIQREVGPEEYLVKKGDSLRKIAKMMGDAMSWTKIYEANKDIIGEDRSRLYPYTVLRMPK